MYFPLVYFRLYWLLAAFLTIGPAPGNGLYAAQLELPPVVLSTTPAQQSLGRYAMLFRDTDHQRPLHTLLQPAVQAQFQPSAQENISLGFTADVVWLKVRIQNDTPLPEQRWLEIPYPLLDFITLYQQDTYGTYQAQETGDHFPFAKRPIPYRNFVFALTFPPQQTQTLYLRIKSDSSMNIPLVLWEPEAFADYRNQSNIILAFYASLLIGMILYNGLLYFAVKDVAYLYYVLFITNWLFFVFGLYGVSPQLFWPNNIGWANQSIPLFICLATLSMILFSQNFLYARQRIPILHQRVFHALLAISVAGTALSLFLNYTISIKLATILACLTSLICALIGIQRWWAGWQAAQYYVIAWTVLFIGIISFGLKAAGVVPDNEWTRWSLHIGAVLQMMLFSLALANRINLSRQSELQAHEDKYQAQQVALDNMQRAKEMALQGSEAKTNFILHISNQFKIPLMTITQHSQLLQEGLVLEGLSHLQGDMQPILQSAHTLDHLVDEVLELAQLDQPLPLLPGTTIDLVPLVQKTIALQQPRYLDAPLIELKTAQPQILIVTAPSHLKSLLGHLLDNALKFTRQGGIIVSLLPDPLRPGWLCITIEDSGPGIAGDQLLLIQRLLTQPSQQSRLMIAHGHNGLGLLISKRLSDLLGGFITINSEVGRGTLVTVRLPNGYDVITDRLI